MSGPGRAPFTTAPTTTMPTPPVSTAATPVTMPTTPSTTATPPVSTQAPVVPPSTAGSGSVPPSSTYRGSTGSLAPIPTPYTLIHSTGTMPSPGWNPFNQAPRPWIESGTRPKDPFSQREWYDSQKFSPFQMLSSRPGREAGNYPPIGKLQASDSQVWRTGVSSSRLSRREGKGPDDVRKDVDRM